jgi:uncharacterized membrane protein
MTRDSISARWTRMTGAISTTSRVIIVLTLIGMGLSAYLTIVHWGWIPLVCFGGSGGCEVVNLSMYAQIVGIPVALLGFLAYGAIFLLSFGGWFEDYAHWAFLARFTLALVGVLFSVYLTYIELFILHEICQWCVASAIDVTLIAILASRELD